MDIMDRVDELRADAATLLDEARDLVVAAEEEDRDLNEQEQTEYDALRSRAERKRSRADRLEDQHRAESTVPEQRSRGTTQPGDREEPRARPESGSRGDSPENFRSLHEFIGSCLFRTNDPRLQDLWQGRHSGGREEHREQSMGVGAKGGFAVPEQFRLDLMSVDSEAAVIRPRATVIPAGSPPDAKINMVALDQGDESNMEGGVGVTWIDEGAAKPPTSFDLRQVTLEPNEVAANIPLTDKLLRNWGAAAATTEMLLRRAIVAAEERKFIAGDGDGVPLGFQASAAAITHPREVAATVSYEDLVSMEEQAWGRNLVWIGSRRVKGQLRRMEDTEGHLVWQESARTGDPASVLGYPFIEYHRTPQLGAAGDLSLVDLGFYLIKDGSGPFIEAGHAGTDFTDNKTRIKVFWNVDGKPWLVDPFTLDNGDTASPFILLGEPSES